MQLRNLTLLWEKLRGAGSVQGAGARSGGYVALPRSQWKGAGTVAAAAPWQTHPMRRWWQRGVELEFGISWVGEGRGVKTMERLFPQWLR